MPDTEYLTDLAADLDSAATLVATEIEPIDLPLAGRIIGRALVLAGVTMERIDLLQLTPDPNPPTHQSSRERREALQKRIVQIEREQRDLHKRP